MRWIIGDIHGMREPLERLLEAVLRHDPAAQLYFVGDYVNRGPDSRGVIELLRKLSNARFIRGNHDDIFDEMLSGQYYAPNATEGSRLVAFKWFMDHGMQQTMASYGAQLVDLVYLAEFPTAERLEPIVALVPHEHRAFVRALPPVIEEDDFFVAHGKWRPELGFNLMTMSVQLDRSRLLRHELLWGRFNLTDIWCEKAWGRIGYFGHTPVDNYPELLISGDYRPVRGSDMRLLDTACALCAPGRLTAYCHETQEYLQASHFGMLVTKDPVSAGA